MRRRFSAVLSESSLYTYSLVQCLYDVEYFMLKQCLNIKAIRPLLLRYGEGLLHACISSIYYKGVKGIKSGPITPTSIFNNRSHIQCIFGSECCEHNGEVSRDYNPWSVSHHPSRGTDGGQFKTLIGA